MPTVSAARPNAGRPARGKWYVDDAGHFGSFWPPSYRASYDLHWIVEDGAIVGLRFTELGGGSVRRSLPRLIVVVTVTASAVS
jgi:hypothetical protein